MDFEHSPGTIFADRTPREVSQRLLSNQQNSFEDRSPLLRSV
jgi:hypothetical protein